MKTWKSVITANIGNSAGALQWGHVDEDVEE